MGVKVGTTLGALVRNDDGWKEGKRLGIWLGILVGIWVGIQLGKEDWLGASDWLGSSLGAVVSEGASD